MPLKCKSSKETSYQTFSASKSSLSKKKIKTIFGSQLYLCSSQLKDNTRSYRNYILATAVNRCLSIKQTGNRTDVILIKIEENQKNIPRKYFKQIAFQWTFEVYIYSSSQYPQKYSKPCEGQRQRQLCGSGATLLWMWVSDQGPSPVLSFQTSQCSNANFPCSEHVLHMKSKLL